MDIAYFYNEELIQMVLLYNSLLKLDLIQS